MEVTEEFYDELIAYVDHKIKRRELDSNKRQKILNLLGLAQRAGRLVSGEDLVVEAIQKGRQSWCFSRRCCWKFKKSNR